MKLCRILANYRIFDSAAKGEWGRNVATTLDSQSVQITEVFKLLKSHSSLHNLNTLWTSSTLLSEASNSDSVFPWFAQLSGPWTLDVSHQGNCCDVSGRCRMESESDSDCGPVRRPSALKYSWFMKALPCPKWGESWMLASRLAAD